MSEFQRETRYGVTKIKRLLPKQKDAFFQEFSELCAKHGTKSVACVVVEKGWPIYEEVWDMVQRLAEGREQKIEQLQHQNDELNLIKKRYEALIFAVGNKYPDESRHETALRYIQQSENRGHQPCGAGKSQQSTNEGV